MDTATRLWLHDLENRIHEFACALVAKLARGCGMFSRLRRQFIFLFKGAALLTALLVTDRAHGGTGRGAGSQVQDTKDEKEGSR